MAIPGSPKQRVSAYREGSQQNEESAGIGRFLFPLLRGPPYRVKPQFLGKFHSESGLHAAAGTGEKVSEIRESGKWLEEPIRDCRNQLEY